MVLESASAGIWHACDETRAGVRSWEGESSAVFYSAHSGDTHLIDALAVELHELLSARPMSEPQILLALADVVEPGCEMEAASELHEHLLRLKGFGLLRESLD